MSSRATTLELAARVLLLRIQYVRLHLRVLVRYGDGSYGTAMASFDRRESDTATSAPRLSGRGGPGWSLKSWNLLCSESLSNQMPRLVTVAYAPKPLPQKLAFTLIGPTRGSRRRLGVWASPSSAHQGRSASVWAAVHSGSRDSVPMRHVRQSRTRTPVSERAI